MEYAYTDIGELNVSLRLTLNDIDRLRRCIAEFEPEENVWFFRRFKETLRECQKQAAESMQNQSEHIKCLLEEENETN